MFTQTNSPEQQSSSSSSSSSSTHVDNVRETLRNSLIAFAEEFASVAERDQANAERGQRAGQTEDSLQYLMVRFAARQRPRRAQDPALQASSVGALVFHKQ